MLFHSILISKIVLLSRVAVKQQTQIYKQKIIFIYKSSDDTIDHPITRLFSFNQIDCFRYFLNNKLGPIRLISEGSWFQVTMPLYTKLLMNTPLHLEGILNNDQNVHKSAVFVHLDMVNCVGVLMHA